MNQKKLMLIGSLALIITTSLTIAAFRLASNQENISIGKASSSPLGKTIDGIASEEEVSFERKEISKKGHKLIENKLVTPLRKKLDTKGRSSKFSRCPSGVQYYEIDVEDETDAFIVKVVNFDGCSPIDICLARLSYDEKELSIWDAESASYIQPEIWLSNIKIEDFRYLEIEEELLPKPKKENNEQKAAS